MPAAAAAPEPVPVLAVVLILLGCCCNAVALQHIVQIAPGSGNLLTLAQMLLVTVLGLASQLQRQAGAVLPVLPRRRQPLPWYLGMVAVLFVVALLNNSAFRHNVPIPVHMVIRAGNMVTSALARWLLLSARPTAQQAGCVVVATAGLVATSVPVSAVAQLGTASALWHSHGTLALLLGMVLSAVLGVAQEVGNARYAPSSAEASLYTHMLALPLFATLRDELVTQAGVWAAAPSVLVWVAVNLASQAVCITGVFLLTTQCNALTVTVVLSGRKAASLLISAAVFGNVLEPSQWLGAVCVFASAFVYARAKPSASHHRIHQPRRPHAKQA